VRVTWCTPVYAAFFHLWPDTNTWLKPTEIIQYAKNEADKPNSGEFLELLKNTVGDGDAISPKKLGWSPRMGTGRVISGKRLLVRAVGSHQKSIAWLTFN
jgi:hypothetical protein